MRLTCPRCAAQYQIADAAIPAAGREVECSACGHVWHQEGLAKSAPEPAAAGFDPQARPVLNRALDESVLAILRDGASRLRMQHATPTLRRLREAVGLRDLSQVSTVDAKSAKKEASATVPTFKQYRDADGKFYFKLVQGERVLLQSTGFASPRDAGQRIAAIKQGEIGDGASDFALGEGVGDEEVNAALAAFVAAQLEGEAGKA